MTTTAHTSKPAKLDKAAIRRRVENTGEIPTLPDIVQKLLTLTMRDDISAEDLGKIIEKDQVLAAKVLKLVNSPYYGFPARIASISHAVALLGLTVVKSLVLCASAFDMIQTAGIRPLWHHSLGTAIMAHILAKRNGLKSPEETFAAGLLHDFGEVVMASKLPELASLVMQAIREQDLSRLEAERAVLDLTHTEIASWLAEQWRLPVSVKEAMVHHHQPMLAQDAREQTAIVHVADYLVNAIGFGHLGIDPVPTLSPDAWRLVKLDQNGLTAVIATAEQEFTSIDDYQL